MARITSLFAVALVLGMPGIVLAAETPAQAKPAQTASAKASDMTVEGKVLGADWNADVPALKVQTANGVQRIALDVKTSSFTTDGKTLKLADQRKAIEQAVTEGRAVKIQIAERAGKRIAKTVELL